MNDGAAPLGLWFFLLLCIYRYAAPLGLYLLICTDMPPCRGYAALRRSLRRIASELTRPGGPVKPWARNAVQPA